MVVLLLTLSVVEADVFNMILSLTEKLLKQHCLHVNASCGKPFGAYDNADVPLDASTCHTCTERDACEP